MEEGAINVPNEIVRSGTFPRTRHRQRASSAQDIDQRGSSSIPSFPGHLDLPTTPPYQQPDVSNLESNGFTNQRQEEDAGDASAKALWPLFVKIEPALSSLLRDLADWKAERKSQVESVQTDVKEASSTENVENSDQTNESNESNERAKRFKYLSIYLPLYRAGLKGDWQAAKAILDNDRDAVRVPITPKGENILHIAVLANRCTFVKEVLKLMCPEDLELKDGGFTALYYAAVSGNVKIAEEMVKKNSKLPLIHCGDNSLPLDMATLLDNRDMMSYLFSVTPFKQWTANDRIDILIQTITADLYDIAWKILQRDETLATVEDSYGRIALEVLAKKPFALGSRSQMSTWERCFSYIAWKILRKDETLATAEDSNGHIEVLVEKPFALGSRSQMSTWERCFSC